MSQVSTSLYCSTEDVRQLRIRTHLWERNGFEGGDEELFRVLNAIGSLQHVSSVWSCAGHKGKDRAYLMLAFDEQGFYQVLDLFSSMQRSLSVQFTFAYRVSLSLCQSLWPIKDERFQHTYPVAIIDYNFDVPQEQQEFLEVLSTQVELWVTRCREREVADVKA